MAPKPIERQKISLCLNVFCENLKCPEIPIRNVDGTVAFMEKIISFFKTMNVKVVYEDVRTRDPLKSTTSSVDDERLRFLSELGDMAEKNDA